MKFLKTYENFSGDVLLYHGTSMKQWNENKNEKSLLYLTNEEIEAKNYSYEICIGEDEIDDETGEVIVNSEPILCIISMNKLKELDVEFQPDWGGYGVKDDTTWEETYNNFGSFSIYGEIDSIKKHFQIKKIQ